MSTVTEIAPDIFRICTYVPQAGLQFSQFKSFDFALIGQAVRKGDATIGLVLSSDGTLGG